MVRTVLEESHRINRMTNQEDRSRQRRRLTTVVKAYIDVMDSFNPPLQGIQHYLLGLVLTVYRNISGESKL